MYPTQVTVNEKNLAKLIKTYQSAYAEIVDEITIATDFGVANREQILAQIDDILAKIGGKTQDWLEQEIPKQYESGADDAVKQLKNIDAPIEVEKGFNKIHQEAVTALIDETAKAFGEGMSGVSRSANNLLGRLVREQITQKMAKGMIAGEALREVRREIKGQLLEEGITALIDRGGNKWSLDRYADMLFRTKMVEARNRGVANRLVENGYDLVQVSSHNTSHQECAVWEGKILSATGATKGYPTVRDAENAGLFHPNCKHAINVMIPKLSNMTHAYDPTKETLTPDELESKIDNVTSK